MSHRYSTYSGHSAGPPSQPGMQVSTTTLLNALHSHYTTGQPYQLDAGTSLVVNTWLNANQPAPDGSNNGGTVDQDLAFRAWEHARRRAEDGCIVLWFEIPYSPTLVFRTSCTDSLQFEAQFINLLHLC